MEQSPSSPFLRRKFLCLIITLTLSCSILDGNGGDVSGNDIRHYKTDAVGSQTWMLENLNYKVGKSKCYDDNDANCTKYGRLYNWATAMDLPDSCNINLCETLINDKHRGICPEGWHVPSNVEWDSLAYYVQSNKSCSKCDAKYLKATSGWEDFNDSTGNGLSEYNFAALPGGFGIEDGDFYHLGFYGTWWSSSMSTATGAYIRTVSYSNDASYREFYSKLGFRSLRCLQD